MKNETSHERFLRLATKRTNTILDHLRVLGNCSNRNSYEYTDEEVRKIFNAIDTELQHIKAKFKNSKKKKFEL